MSAVLEAAAWALAPRVAALPLRSARECELLEGLSRAQKAVSADWLFDARGRELHATWTRSDAHYAARSEVALMRRAAPVLARAAAGEVGVLELGHGHGRATELLLAAVDAAAFHAVDPRVADVNDAALLQGAALALAATRQPVVYFPGAGIGRFSPQAAMALLGQLGKSFGRGTLMLVAADATQEPKRLLPAYDDRAGLAAAFNKHLLARWNRELDAGFEASAFAHQARWNAAQHAVELHLVARVGHVVPLLGERIAFAAGESIHTLTCRKHTLLMFRALTRHAGWAHREFWMDSSSAYALHLLEYLG